MGPPPEANTTKPPTVVGLGIRPQNIEYRWFLVWLPFSSSHLFFHSARFATKCATLTFLFICKTHLGGPPPPSPMPSPSPFESRVVHESRKRDRPPALHISVSSDMFDGDAQYQRHPGNVIPISHQVHSEARPSHPFSNLLTLCRYHSRVNIQKIHPITFHHAQNPQHHHSIPTTLVFNLRRIRQLSYLSVPLR
jgi:hypothetical protein